LKEEFLSFVLFSLFFKTFLDLNKLLDYSLWTMNYINTNDLFLSLKELTITNTDSSKETFSNETDLSFVF
jgi:hypothetical protein